MRWPILFQAFRPAGLWLQYSLSSPAERYNDNYPYKSHWQRGRALYACFGCFLFVFFNGWQAFLGGELVPADMFIPSYISVSSLNPWSILFTEKKSLVLFWDAANAFRTYLADFCLYFFNLHIQTQWCCATPRYMGQSSESTLEWLAEGTAGPAQRTVSNCQFPPRF